MSKLRRLKVTGKIFFVTCNIAKGVKLLSPRERDLVLETVAETRQRLGFRLFAYVVMPSHWHALLLPAPGQTVSAAMHAIKRLAALRINESRRTSGPLWQARFFDRFLRRVKDFHEAVEYIHTNPVRDGFVRESAAWPWSSGAEFCGEKRPAVSIDTVNLPLEPDRNI